MDQVRPWSAGGPRSTCAAASRSPACRAAEMQRVAMHASGLAVLAACVEAEMLAGADTDLALAVEAAVAADPFHERLVGMQLILLCRAGRQAEAINVFTATREALAISWGSIRRRHGWRSTSGYCAARTTSSHATCRHRAASLRNRAGRTRSSRGNCRVRCRCPPGGAWSWPGLTGCDPPLRPPSCAAWLGWGSRAPIAIAASRCGGWWQPSCP